MLNRYSCRLRLIILIFLVGGIYGRPGFAHEGRPIYIQLQEVSEKVYSLRWKIPPVMEPGTEPDIYLKGAGCQKISGVEVPRHSAVKMYQCQSLSFNTIKSPTTDLQIYLAYPVANPVLSTLIHFERINGDAVHLFNGPGVLEVNLPADLSAWECVRQYIKAGFLHILEGYDHLLFVLCLVFIARGLRGVLIAVTGFTLGHSITLGLASLNFFTIRVDVVEVLIPLSIMVLAAEIINAGHSRDRNTLSWRFPAIVASGFGLLHGFGFASALTGLGLPHDQKLVALISFNAGVELGQLVFVLFVLLLTYMVKLIFLRWGFSVYSLRGLMPSTSAVYPVGVVSGYWLIERSLELVS
ncbi:HupE/UreJ family protein [Microbulbifer variabilis]|uniref:HupE/UreJ family protein n=1 Tax=Microbulbifer variabilis TaxID=266805 RepID=UPI0003630243|nr:HupE/UreJ family protein [Microbulbifer variabilis]